MAFPSISAITDAVKDMVSGAPSDSTTETEATAEVTNDESETTEATATTDQEAETPTVETTPPDPAVISQFIDKDARAWFEGLTETAKESLRPVVNKKYYDGQNEKQREIVALRAQVAEIPNIVKGVVAEQFDALRLEAMPEEERKSFLEKKELARLKAKEAESQQPKSLTAEEMRDVFAKTPLANTFWEAAKEIGLPADPADPAVNAFFNDVLREFPNTTSAEHGAMVIKSIAPKYRKSPKAEDMEAIIARRVAEQVEAAVEKRLKSGLKVDTGKSGASIGGKPKPKTTDEARVQALELIEASNR